MASQGKPSIDFFALGLFGAAALIFVGFAPHWVAIIQQLSIDYWDGMNFVLQARRLTDPQFQDVLLDMWRPRTLVGFLSGFDLLFKAATGHFPQLIHYHAFMASLTVFFFCMAFVAVKRLWGLRAAVLALIFLLVTEILHHYSMMILADITTGLFWMLTLAIYLPSHRDDTSNKPPETEMPMSHSRAFLCGVFGACAGMGKYHFLLLAPVMFGFHFLFAPKKMAKSFGVFLLAYFVTLQSGLYFFSRGEAGILGHAAELFRQVKVAAQLKRPPEIYIDGLLKMYGPVFWALAVVALLRFFTKRNRVKGSLFQSSVIVSVLLHALLTQAISQREIRYLIPLLPVLLGAVAVLVLEASRSFPVRQKVLWSLLWGSALLYPWQRSWRDLQTTVNSPVYQSMAKGMEPFWKAFQEPGVDGKSCQKIYACAFSFRPTGWEFPLDQYYRSFDLGPHYRFHTGLSATLLACPRFVQTNRGIEPSLSGVTDPEACYVIPVTSPAGTGLTLVRSVPKLFQTFSSAPQSHSPEKSLFCEGSSPQFRCYSLRGLFLSSTQQFIH